MDEVSDISYTKELGSVDEYNARRLSGNLVHICATGHVPNLQTRALFEQSPIRIMPPQYILWFLSPKITSPVVTPFSISRLINHPTASEIVTIHDRNGPHEVPVGNDGQLDFRSSSEGLLGVSPVSLQDAFDAAVGQYEWRPDELVTFAVVNQGKTQGGIAGLSFYFVEVVPKS